MNRKIVFGLLILMTGLYSCTNGDSNYKKAEKYYQKAKKCVKQRDADGVLFNLGKAIDLGYLEKKGSTGSIHGIMGRAYLVKGEKKQAKKYLTLSLKEYKKELKWHEQENHHKLIGLTKEMIRKTKRQLEKLKE